MTIAQKKLEKLRRCQQSPLGCIKLYQDFLLQRTEIMSFSIVLSQVVEILTFLF